jgi:hypothetical protein
MEQKFHYGVYVNNVRGISMQAAIDRVMQTYGMIVNLNADEERAARQKVAAHLAGKATNAHLPWKACDIFEALENRIRAG